MRQQKIQSLNQHIRNYTNDSFIRRDSKITYTPNLKTENFNKILQENFYLKRLSSQIIFLLTLEESSSSKRNKPTDTGNQVRRMMREWRRDLEEGEVEVRELTQSQVLEVIEWMTVNNLSLKTQVEALEVRLRKSESEKDKYLKSLEKVQITGTLGPLADEDFDGDYFQRKLGQVKEQIGESD
jgi:hypothetical protein